MLWCDILKEAMWVRKMFPLDHNQLVTRAMSRTGLKDLDSPQPETALQVLVKACNEEADLSLFGHFAARFHFSDLLETRLRLVRYWQEKPEIGEQKIASPIFVTGLARSGSTFLHGLLSQDPDNRAPLTWELMFPFPAPTRKEFHSDPRIAKAENRLRWIRRAQPSIVKVHPVGAALPQECIAITSYTFLSDEFLTMFRIPSYETWLRSQDMGPAYQFHRQFLKYLQWHCSGERWVLKAPDHVHALSTLFEIYPDARVVFLHRDPIKVAGSAASLAMVLKEAFSRKRDPLQTGADELRALTDIVRKIMVFQESHPFLREQFMNLQYLDLVRDPIGAVRSIYNRFRLTLSSDAETRMKASLNGAGKYKNAVRLADFGLDPHRIGTLFTDYYEHYGIEKEPVQP